jgi:hypothetical protein
MSIYFWTAASAVELKCTVGNVKRAWRGRLLAFGDLRPRLLICTRVEIPVKAQVDVSVEWRLHTVEALEIVV